jgi:hypothetical protein
MVVGVQDCDSPAQDDETVSFIDIGANAKSIQELLNSIRLKNMDIFIAIDSCCTKKTGRELVIIPKFKIIQTVIRDSQTQTMKHVGLRLFK